MHLSKFSTHSFVLFSVAEYYDHLWSLRDKRVDNWPLMQSIVPTLVLSGLYLIICILIGPRFMKNRQPFEFKYLMQAYNLQQVLTSCYVFYEIMSLGWSAHYNWVCQPVEMDSSNNTQRMVKTSKHFNFILY